MPKISLKHGILVLSLWGTMWAGCATTELEKKELTQTQRARLLVEIANGALLEGDPTGALQHLTQAEEWDSRLPELHHSKALAFHAKHNLPRAIESAQTAVKLMPKYSDANNTLGKLLIDAGRYDEAIPPLLTAANDPLNRGSFKSHTNLGILYYRRGQTEKALEHLNLAIRDAPAVACFAYYYKGHVLLKNGKVSDAIREYDRATHRFCAGFADAHLALGIAYERSRQYDRARKKFLDIKQSFPNTQIAEQAMDRLKYIP